MNFVKYVAFLLVTVPPVIADAPWFTLVSNNSTGPGSIRCGGVLVHPDIVLTAGECADMPNNTVLRVGYRNDTDADFLVAYTMVVNHPNQWIGGNFRFQENLPNDLQLIKLNQSITGIQPIKLYDGCCGYDDDNKQSLYFAQAGTPTDFFDVPKEGFPQSRPPKPFNLGSAMSQKVYHTSLQEGSVFTKNFIHCRREYVDIPGYHAKLKESVQFCTKSNTSSPCDSNAWGSPLYNNETGEPILVGIASQGECTPGGLPHIYTRIAHYFDFLRERICNMTSVQQSTIDCLELTT